MAVPLPGTREFEVFQRNIAYARSMVDAGRSIAALRAQAVDVGDFYRAAWVQAVSAIDHWFHEVLYWRVAELAAQAAAALPGRLAQFELPLRTVEEIRRGAVTLADATAEHVRTKWSNAALRNPRKISEALKLVTDVDVWSEAARLLNEWHRGRTAMSARSLKKRYTVITERRNWIAHDADLLEGDLSNRRAITDSDVTDAIDWLERIALAIAHTPRLTPRVAGCGSAGMIAGARS